MDFMKYMNSENDVILQQIASNLQQYPLISKFLTKNVIEDSIRRKLKYKNDLAFILATDKNLLRKLLEHCFNILQNCKGFEKKVKSFNNYNTISPVLAELEFATLFKQSSYEVEFEPVFPNTSKTCEFKATSPNGEEIYVEMKALEEELKYDKVKKSLDHLRKHIIIKKFPFKFLIRFRKSPTMDDINQLLKLFKNEARRHKQSYDYLPSKLYYPSKNNPEVEVEILGKSDTGMPQIIMTSLPPHLPTGIGSEINNIIQDKMKEIQSGGQFLDNQSNIALIDLSLSYFGSWGDVYSTFNTACTTIQSNNGNSLLMKINGKELRGNQINRISAFIIYTRDLNSTMINRTLFYCENPQAMKAIPDSIKTLFDSQNGNTYSFFLNKNENF